MNEVAWSKHIVRFSRAQGESDLRLGRERQVWDKSRVDILTDKLAIEVDWAKKWCEAVGQSLWYADNFARAPGICLLSDDFKNDAKYIYRCQVICSKQNIELWLVDTTKNFIIIRGDKLALPEIA